MESNTTHIYLAFRPNLDGFYSALNTFFFFRDLQKAKISNADFDNYISQFNSFEEINQNICQFMQKNPPKPTPSVPVKKGKEPKVKAENLSKDAVKDLLYVSVKYIAETDFYFPFEWHYDEMRKNSLLIFIGGFPDSMATLQNFSKGFRKSIFIHSHPISENYANKFTKKKDYPSNIMHFCNTEKSGATLSLEFFEKLKGAPLLLDPLNQTKLCEILSYIEDRHCKKKRLENSENFVSGLGLCNPQADYDPWHNPGAFKLLFDVKIDHLINKGKAHLEEIAEKIQKLMFKDKCEIDLGGRLPNGTPKYGRCYAVKTHDPSFKIQLLEEIALKSAEKEGFEEVGAIFGRKDGGKEDDWKISLYFPKKGSVYKNIAKEFPDQVFNNSIEIFIKFEDLKDWTLKDYFPNIKLR